MLICHEREFSIEIWLVAAAGMVWPIKNFCKNFQVQTSTKKQMWPRKIVVLSKVTFLKRYAQGSKSREGVLEIFFKNLGGGGAGGSMMWNC